jgi:hypothetical protein
VIHVGAGEAPREHESFACCEAEAARGEEAASRNEAAPANGGVDLARARFLADTIFSFAGAKTFRDVERKFRGVDGGGSQAREKFSRRRRRFSRRRRRWFARSRKVFATSNKIFVTPRLFFATTKKIFATTNDFSRRPENFRDEMTFLVGFASKKRERAD